VARRPMVKTAEHCGADLFSGRCWRSGAELCRSQVASRASECYTRKRTRPRSLASGSGEPPFTGAGAAAVDVTISCWASPLPHHHRRRHHRDHHRRRHRVHYNQPANRPGAPGTCFGPPDAARGAAWHVPATPSPVTGRPPRAGPDAPGGPCHRPGPSGQRKRTCLLPNHSPPKASFRYGRERPLQRRAGGRRCRGRRGVSGAASTRCRDPARARGSPAARAGGRMREWIRTGRLAMRCQRGLGGGGRTAARAAVAAARERPVGGQPGGGLWVSALADPSGLIRVG
jgi:hypothetical protein